MKPSGALTIKKHEVQLRVYLEAGFVENDYEYLYSSARDYAEIKGLVNIEKI